MTTFETFLTHEQRRPKAGRRITYAVSILMHGVGLCLAVAYSFMHVDELSLPKAVVTFAGAIVPPPPPPPPKGSVKPRPRPHPTRVVAPSSKEVVQPREEPPRQEAESDEPPGDPEGHPNGVKDGIPGGPGIGGPPPVTQTAFLPPKVATGQLAIDPQDPRYAAHLPTALARAGMSLWALVKVCVRAGGDVEDVTLLRRADPAVDPLIVAAISRWRYRPYTVDGRPVPFCTNVRYEITTR
jgi:outer membrane biosynthesis protein TonB